MPHNQMRPVPILNSSRLQRWRNRLTDRRSKTIIGAVLFFSNCLVCSEQYLEGEWARNALFIKAAGCGDNTVVRAFLDSGISPNTQNFHSRSALQNAAYAGHLETVRLLLDRGADPTTGLRFNARKGNVAVFALLVARGAKVQGAAGAPVLSEAVQSGDIAIVNLLLRQGVDVNAFDDSGRLAIQQAASSGSGEIFQTLIDKGANLTARSRSGETELMSAASGDNAVSTRLCRYIIQHGADINAKDNNGQTALIHAVSLQQDSPPHDLGILTVLDILLRSGANVNARDVYGRTALRYAAEFRNVKVKERLKSAGALP